MQEKLGKDCDKLAKKTNNIPYKFDTLQFL